MPARAGDPELERAGAASVPVSPARRRAGHLVLFALILLGGTGLRLLEIRAPWSDLPHDWHTIFGSMLGGGRVRALAEHGLLDGRLMPYDWRVAYDDGEVTRTYYTHHPPLFMLAAALLLRLFGPEEWALRALPLFFSLLAIWSCYLLGRTWRGPPAGLLAAFVASLLPLATLCGVLFWTEGAIAALVAFAAREQLLWLRGGGRRHLYRVALLMALGGLLDWPMAFASGAFFAHAWWNTRRDSLAADRRVTYWLPIATTLTVLLHRLHLALVLPHGAVQTQKGVALRSAMGLDPDFAPGVFFTNQAIFLERYLTPPGLLLFGAALLLSLVRIARGRLGAEGWLMLALLVPALLYIGLFPGRSHIHDFFMLVSLPWFAIALADLGTSAWGALAPRLGRLPTALLGALVLASLGTASVQRTLERQAEMSSDRLQDIAQAPEVRALLDDPEAIVVTHVGRGLGLAFYSRATVLWGLEDPAALRARRDELVERIAPPRRLVYLVDLLYFPVVDADGRLAQTLAGFGATQPVRTALGQELLFVDLRSSDRDAPADD
jgi:hypothetical protein